MKNLQTIIKLVFEYITKMFAFLTPEEKKKIIKDIDIQLAIIKNSMKENETPQEALLRIAKENLGRDISFNDEVPDEVACASTLSLLIKKLSPEFPHITGTWTLLHHLKDSNIFEATNNLDAGNIIISATGTGNGMIRGHAGVILENEKIASNDSYTGLWLDNYTIESWVKRYRNKGGFPIYVFKFKG